MSDQLRLLGVVLSGGRSSRMGQDKATLRHHLGLTFLDYSVNRLAAVCDSVAVSGGSPQHRYRVIPDPVDHLGPAIGVAASLAAASNDGFDACLFTPVDMPDLKPDDLRSLRHTWHSDPTQIVCGISPWDGRPQPLVAIFPVGFCDSLDQLARSNDRSLNRWLNQQEHLAVPLSPESCHNVNCPEDLEA